MDRFLPHVRPYVPGCSNDWINRAVLNAATRFCVRSRIWQQETEHELAVDGETITLTIPDDSAVDSVNVSDEYRARADYTLSGKVITFDDAFSSATDITVVAFLKPDREADSLNDTLCDNWFEGIEAGAKAELMMMPGKPWTNLELSAVNQRMYLHSVGEATIRANKKNSQEVLVVTSRRFV